MRVSALISVELPGVITSDDDKSRFCTNETSDQRQMTVSTFTGSDDLISVELPGVMTMMTKVISALMRPVSSDK